MNENLNLLEVLKDCPKGTKLYSTMYGEVEFEGLKDGSSSHPVIVKLKTEQIEYFTSTGKWTKSFDGECTLFPSRTQRNWAEFKPKQPKFDPKTLQPYMKVLVRDTNDSQWRCAFYSHERENEKSLFKYTVTGSSLAYVYCIPYNDETKHLVGTTEEAPEFYRYWED